MPEANERGKRSVLTFDFGSKSIGVAIGQEITGTASPLPALKARDGIPDWHKLQQLFDQWQPDLAVVGLPLNMDGSNQQVTFAARKFANRLNARYGVKVETCDERLTTADAKAELFHMGGYRKLDKQSIDSASACLIFESWINQQYQ